MNSLLTLKGNLSERLATQGQHFKNTLNKLIQEIACLPVTKNGWRMPPFFHRIGLPLLGHHYLKKHKTILEQSPGDLFSGIKTLAEGFSVSPHFLYGFQAIEPLSSKLPYALGCCSLTMTAEATSEHKPLLAYNHDFPDAFGPFLFIKKNISTDGFSNLSVGYPPLMGAIAGVNEHGLCVSLNHAYATDTQARPGLAPTLLVQQTLNLCKDVQGALDFIQNTPTTNGSMITLMDLKENRAVIEVSCQRKQIRIPQKSIDATMNQYQMPFMQEIEIPLTAQGKSIYSGHLIHEHSLKRRIRFDTIVSKHSGLVSKNDIHQWLSDHEDKAGDFHTLCRHHPQTGSTLCSLILSPRDLSIDMIWGKPCAGKYETYTLAG